MPDRSNEDPSKFNPDSMGFQRGEFGLSVQPTDIKIRKEEQAVQIFWADGAVQRIGFTELRKNCPCAECRAERDRQGHTLLPILKTQPPAGRPVVASATLVGNYAIQFFWADGHSTGIYDFRFLRQLCDAKR